MSRDNLPKPPRSSRGPSRYRDEDIVICRDGPTVTRSRPGYVNPLRMNPPTPPGSRAQSPVDKARSSSAAEENKTSSTYHSSASHSPNPVLDMAQFNKAITEQLEKAFQIRGNDESSPLLPASEASGDANADQAKVDDGPRDPDHASEALVQGVGKMAIDSKESVSAVASHADDDDAAAAHSEVAGQTPVDTTDTHAVDAPKIGGEVPAKTEGVNRDEDVETAKIHNDKAQDSDESKNAAGGSAAREGKKPAKIPSSMHLNLGTSSNFHGLNETTKSSNDTAEKPAQDDALAAFDEEYDGKKLGLRNISHSAMAKLLKEGTSALFSKVKKEGDDSKENSPTFADLNQENPQEYKVELARRYTNTCVELLSPTDTKSPRRPDDDRVWHSRNLRCINCQGSCPICEADCCVYRAAKEVLTKPENPQTEMCARLVELIESLGPRAKDVSTFTMCTLETGCGRRVCPSCCGECPNAICRDIQCKECKPDPWADCDWHA